MTDRKRLQRGKPPIKDLEITFAITETTEGKLGILCNAPDHAAGTVALVLANLAMECMREAMRQVGRDSDMTESRLQ